MGEIIKIQREEKAPMVQCPKCKKIQRIDLHLFDRDVTQIWKDNCVGCGTELHVCIMILVHPTFKGIIECIKIVANALNPGTFLNKI